MKNLVNIKIRSRLKLGSRVIKDNEITFIDLIELSVSQALDRKRKQPFKVKLINSKSHSHILKLQYSVLDYSAK